MTLYITQWVLLSICDPHLGYKEAPDNIKGDTSSSIPNDFNVSYVHACQRTVDSGAGLCMLHGRRQVVTQYI